MAEHIQFQFNHFETLAEYKRKLDAGEISPSDVSFIKETGQILTLGGNYGGSGGADVDLSQYLTATQIAEIYATIEEVNKRNVAIEDVGSVVEDVEEANVIRYVEQALTESQKSQARANIDATSPSSFKTINGQSLVGEGDIEVSTGVDEDSIEGFIQLSRDFSDDFNNDFAR